MSALLNMLAMGLQLYTFVLLARLLVTWIPNIDPYHPAMQLLFKVTEPVLEPARRLIPPIGMVDISPIVVFFALQILTSIVRDLANSV